MPDPSGAPSAVAAFLRGIERRGALFATLQCGDAARADQALAQALRVFGEGAPALPFPQWPRLFWRALLAAPSLRAGADTATWPPGFAPLAACGSGPRAALLLRLVAGLPDADAASVLGIAPATYRMALQQALPRGADGSADPDAWRALDAAVQDALRALPAERLAHLARLRQAAAQGRRPDLIGPAPVVAQAPVPAQASPRALLRGVLWVGVVLCALALAATFAWPWGQGDGGDPQVRIRPLPPAQAPAQRYDRASALLTEPDFELVAAEASNAMPDDPGFLAWVAAGQPGAGAGDPAAGMRDPMPPVPPGEAGTTDAAPPSEPESADAPR